MDERERIELSTMQQMYLELDLPQRCEHGGRIARTKLWKKQLHLPNWLYRQFSKPIDWIDQKLEEFGQNIKF